MFHRFYPPLLYLRRLPHLVMFGLSLVLNIITWGWLLYNLYPLAGEQIFLHYNILFGVDQVGEWYEILFLPLVGLCILLANAVIGWLLFPRDRFAAYLLNATSVVVQIAIVVAAQLLVLLNV